MELVTAPEGRSFYFDRDADGIQDPGEGARGIRVHRVIAGELRAALLEVSEADLWWLVESTAGGYMFRAQRGGSALSMHSLGAAVDFDPRNNPFRKAAIDTRLGGTPDGRRVVGIFERRGWTWGGRWTRPDAMHFQFARGV